MEGGKDQSLTDAMTPLSYSHDHLAMGISDDGRDANANDWGLGCHVFLSLAVIASVSFSISIQTGGVGLGITSASREPTKMDHG